MSLQLSESCKLSLQRYLYRRKNWPPLAQMCWKSSWNRVLYKPITLYRTQQAYRFRTLQTITASKTDVLKNNSQLSQPSPVSATDAKHLFQQELQQCRQAKLADAYQIAALWDAYVQLGRWKSHWPTAEEYQQLADILYIRAQQTRTSIQWRNLTRAFEDAEDLERTTPSMSTIAIAAYGRSGRLERATAVYECLKEDSSVAVLARERYFGACLHHGVLEKAWHVLKDMNDSQSAPRHLAHFVDICMKKSNLRQAIIAAGVFEPSVDHPQVTVQLWSSYADLMLQPLDLGHASSVESFLAAFAQHASSQLPAAQHLQILFTATHLYTLMNYLTTTSNLRLTTHMCDIMLDMYAQDDNVEYINTVLELMQQHNLVPTSRTTSILLRSIGIRTPVSDTQALYNRLKTKGSLDANMYNAFIQVFGCSQAPKDAQYVAVTAKAFGVNIDLQSHAAIIRGYVELGQTGSALSWLEEIDHQQIMAENTESASLDLHAAVMEGWLNEAKWTRCIDQYNDMKAGPIGKHVQSHPRVMKTVIMAMIADAQWNQCEILLASKPIEFTPKDLYQIIDTLLHLRYKDDKNDTDGFSIPSTYVVRALQALERTLDVHVSAGSAAKIIEALGERGHLRHAHTIYNWILGRVGTGKKGKAPIATTKRCKSSPIYLAMMKAAIECNHPPTAERAWNDLLCRSQYSNRKSDTTHTRKQQPYNMLLNAHAAHLPAPDLSRIKRVFEDMLKERNTPDTITYNTIIKAFVNLGKTDSASHIFETMLESGLPPDSWTINTLIRGWVARKDWAGVERFVKMLRKRQLPASFDTVTFNILIQGFLHLDSSQTAYIQTLKERDEWKWARKLEKKLPAYPLNSDSIWEIFEMSLGRRRSEIEGTCSETTLIDDARPKRTLASAFFLDKHQLEGDDITFQLFSRAFKMAGDKRSAMKLDSWRAQQLM